MRHGGWLLFFVLLAPFLGPRDYGLFLLAFSGVAVVETLFADIAARPLIQAHSVDGDTISTAFVTITLTAGAVSLLLYGIAGGIASTIDDSVFGDMFKSLAVLPLLGALTAVPKALLQRRASFAALTVTTSLGVAAGGIAAVALAIAGAGAWALVAQIVVERFVEVGVLWCAAGQGIGIVWSRRQFDQLVGALDLAAMPPAIAAAQQYVPPLLIGVILGPIAAGLFVVGARLLEALCAILLPSGASATRLASDGDYRCNQVGLARLANRIAFPALTGAILLPIALPALLEPRWWGAIPPAQILLVASIPIAFLRLHSVISASHGAAARETSLATLSAIAAVIVTFVAAPYGLEMAASAFLAQSVLAAVIGVSFSRRQIGADRSSHMQRAFVPPLLVASALWLMADPISTAFAPIEALFALTAGACVLYGSLRWALLSQWGAARLALAVVARENDIADLIEYGVDRRPVPHPGHRWRGKQRVDRTPELQTEGNLG
jgi:PST family polysaccharide transporter